jgi:hypothetical protein
MSPSDLKQVEAPLWVEPSRGKPTLMLFSAVDDRSGVVYDEYRCVYGGIRRSSVRRAPVDKPGWRRCISSKNGDRAQVRCGLQHRHDLGVEEIGEWIGASAAPGLLLG